MKKSFMLAILYLIVLASAFAQNIHPLIHPKKSWIQTFYLNREALPPAGQESGVYYLLLEKQENVELQEVYHRYSYKFLNNEGIQQNADIAVTFDPTYETLIFHDVTIHRGDEVINKLPKSIKTIQHEESMDRFLYDESITAIINLPDIRLGDILEYSYTIKGFNPAFEGNVMEEFYLDRRIAFDKNIYRLISPSAVKINIKNLNTNIQPTINNEGKHVSYLWINEKAKGVMTDSNVPDWYNPFQRVVISSFNSWQEVSQWGVNLYKVTDYDKRMLKKKVDRILTDSTSEEFVMNAIRFVQDDIRYLGFEGGLNGYKPHSPLMVLNQRFGDCKDKSLLLCTILASRGVDAYPVLVNTTEGERINESLPSIVAFDHCVVGFEFKGKTFYVDPTISNQGGTLDTYSFPGYQIGLVLKKEGNLTKLISRMLGYQKEIQTFHMDSIGGGATMEVRTVFEGRAADRERSSLSNRRLDVIQKNYKDYYAEQYPDIVLAEDMKVEDNRDQNQLVTIEKYLIKGFWEMEDETSKKMFCKVRAMTLESYFDVSKSLDRDAPYRLDYPVDKRHEIRVHLPTDWSITADDIHIDNDYYKYSYTSSYHDSLVTITTEYQTKTDALPKEAIKSFISDHGKMRENSSFYLSWDPSVESVSAAPLWPGILVLLIILCVSIYMAFYGYTKYDPQAHYPASWGQRIEGWLILPAIGVVLVPVQMFFSFVTDFQLLNGQPWLINYVNGYTGLAAVGFLEQVYNASMAVFSILVAVLFFRRRSSVPHLMQFYYGVPIAWLFFDLILIQLVAPDTNTSEYTSTIIRSMVAAAIWIPYFRTSQRVKRTFVNRYGHDKDDESLALQTDVVVNERQSV